MESDDIEEPTMDTDASRVWRDVRWKDTPFERSGLSLQERPMKQRKTEDTVDVESAGEGLDVNPETMIEVFLNLDTKHDFNHFTRKPDKYTVTGGIGPVWGQ